VPKVDVGGEAGKFVALETSEKVPADAGRGCRRLRQKFLCVVFAEVKQASSDGG
jgi:hypothetical protein